MIHLGPLWFFENLTLKALNVPFKKVVLPRRDKCGGTEEGIVMDHGFRKGKKLICGPEEEIWWLMAACLFPLPLSPMFTITFFYGPWKICCWNFKL